MVEWFCLSLYVGVCIQAYFCLCFIVSGLCFCVASMGHNMLPVTNSSVFTCIGTLGVGTPSRTGPVARKYLPGFPYS